ncbi:aminopeptidase [Streptomyces sp. RKND-216]|uniref:S28 family serine protease n=1 Tax=Streptomyces sp. RKND-216 TaxID=2562581 RepID=UPI00109DB82A|nr:S28 family serine protease [Streptomyces sp. RKND-216]THA26300.1 aminopeptidase [Streptomyces sp. RKND-216]
MRKALRWLLSLVVLIGTVGIGTASASAESAEHADIKQRLLAIPGMSLIEEKPVDGYRFFLLNYEQPVDHRNPEAGTFQQRLSILHKHVDRPTVFFTSGYNLSTQPRRSEPTQIVDGNQVSMEYRFFTPSRPEPADWSKLTIWQAASDQHRIHDALEDVYDQNWVATGGSKGGMTATYYRRFYPYDMDGTIAYVAPNNVDDRDDRAYDEFFATVGTEKCRTALNAVQREAFVRRDEMVERYRQQAEAEGWTFDLIGDVDRAYEVVVLDLVYAFWQYQPETECANVPAADASTDEIWNFVDAVSGFSFYTDQGLTPYVPYYYQAGTQMGNPDMENAHLDGLLRYPGINAPRSFVPEDIPMEFERRAMRDIDRWVRKHSSEMLFVNGENDPWGAEPFRVGKKADDSYVFTAPGANHGADIASLKDGERRIATEALLDWADVENEQPETDTATKRLTEPDRKLDKQVERQRTFRP